MAEEKAFTIIGYYVDTEQRFATVVQAETADHAEFLVFQELSPEEGSALEDLRICGVIAGEHRMVDGSPHQSSVHDLYKLQLPCCEGSFVFLTAIAAGMSIPESLRMTAGELIDVVFQGDAEALRAARDEWEQSFE